MSHKIKVTPRKDGAVITVDGLDITITVKPSVLAPLAPEAPVVPAPPRAKMDLVRSRLAEYIEELTIAEEAEGIIVRPKGYLGRDKFVPIATIVRELGGRYISAGKESRFVIPKE